MLLSCSFISFINANANSFVCFKSKCFHYSSDRSALCLNEMQESLMRNAPWDANFNHPQMFTAKDNPTKFSFFPSFHEFMNRVVLCFYAFMRNCKARGWVGRRIKTELSILEHTRRCMHSSFVQTLTSFISHFLTFDTACWNVRKKQKKSFIFMKCYTTASSFFLRTQNFLFCNKNHDANKN